MTVLEVENLSVEYTAGGSTINAVEDVSFTIEKGDRFGLIGESGCGKSTIAKAVMGLLPENGRVTSGSVRLVDREPEINLVTAKGKSLRDARWERLSYISQSAMNALDPMYTIGEQIIEAIRLHEDVSKKAARERARELIDRVGIDKEHVDSYPHQLSGGMRQRAMIAMALALNPSLIVADEPTTALDVITQDHILYQIDQLSEQVGNSLFIITHDISVVSETCDKVGVMYAGELAEIGPIEEVFADPEHPYTQGLLRAFPRLETEEDSRLITIEGEPPSLQAPPSGCRFEPRCPYSEERCTQSDPQLTPRNGSERRAACFVTDDGYDIETNYERALEESTKWQTL